MEKIMQSRMDRGFQMYQKEYEDKALEVLRSGWYILGKEDEAFEKEFAAYIGTKYAVGVASGLDALWLAFRVLGIGKGDEVIVQGNTYIASVMGITINDATPVFVEPNSYYEIDENRIEEKITEKTGLQIEDNCYTSIMLETNITTEEEIVLMGLSEPDAVFVLTETVYLNTGNPLHITKQVLLGEYFKFFMSNKVNQLSMNWKKM